jgi:hypothetical protein
MFSYHRILLCCGIFAAQVLFSGCGGTEPAPKSSGTATMKMYEPTGEVLTGKATYNGRPVTGGRIKLFEPKGREYETHLRRDGTYKFSYLPMGELKVVIETESIKNEKTKWDELAKHPTPGLDIPPAESVPIYVKIPEKYRKPETSGLSVIIKKGENTQNFDLKD